MYENRSKNNLKIELDFFKFHNVCITSLFQLNKMEENILVREKIIFLKRFCNRFSIQYDTYMMIFKLRRPIWGFYAEKLQ